MGQTAALFDLDNTLLNASSGQLYTWYLYRHGRTSRAELARVVWWGILSSLGLLDMRELIPKLLSQAAGDDEREMRAFCDRWFVEDVIPHVTEAGTRQVDHHRAQGHVLALVPGEKIPADAAQNWRAQLPCDLQVVDDDLRLRGGDVVTCVGK